MEREFKLHIPVDIEYNKGSVKDILSKIAKEVKDNVYEISFTGDYKDFAKQLVNLQKQIPEIDLTEGIKIGLSDKLLEDSEVGKKYVSELTTFVINSVKEMVSSVDGIKNSIAESERALEKLRARRKELYEEGKTTNASQAYEKAEKRLEDAHAKFIKEGAQPKTRMNALEEMRSAIQDMKNLEKEVGKKIEENSTINNLSKQANDEYKIAEKTFIKIGDLRDEFIKTKPTHNSYAEMVSELDAQIIGTENRLSELKKELETAQNPELQVKGKLANNFIEDLQSQLDSMGELQVKVKPKVDGEIKVEVETAVDEEPTKILKQDTDEIVSDTETAVKNFERLSDRVKKYQEAKADKRLANPSIVDRRKGRGFENISELVPAYPEDVRNNSTTKTGIKRKLDEYLKQKKELETGLTKYGSKALATEKTLSRALDELAAYTYSFKDAEEAAEIFGKKNKDVFNLVQERIELAKKASKANTEAGWYKDFIIHDSLRDDYGVGKITIGEADQLMNAIESNGLEGFAAKVEELFGVKIPTSIEQAKASIQSANEVITTPPNTSAMDTVEEELHEEAQAHRENEEAAKADAKAQEEFNNSQHSNQNGLLSDTTTSSVSEYIKKSDDEIYASGRELAKNRETVLQELAQREIDLANQVSGEKKQIYADMANATFKMSKASIEDGDYKIEEKISSTKNQMDLLQREIESETDPKILDGLNRELDETKIKFIALVNAFKQSGHSFSEVDALSFGSEAIDRYSRTQRENYTVGNSNYSIESESKDYWDNLTKGIKSENELAQAIEQRKQKLVELEKVRRTSEEKDIEAYKKYDSLTDSKERESAWAEYQSLSDKTNEITEQYNEARLELYNLIQLQDNWGKSLEDASKINTSFLGDEWKEEEQVLYAIDDEISSIIEKSKHATQLSNKNNLSSEVTTTQLEKETEIKRDDTAATNELIEAEKKLHEEASKPIVNTTGAESPITPLPPQVEEALVNDEAKVDEVVEAEKKKFGELGTELSIDIPKAIEAKNKALEEEQTKVSEVVKDEIEKFSELNDIINGVKTSVDAKNKSVDEAKDKDWKKNDTKNGEGSDDGYGNEVLERTFVENDTLTGYAKKVSTTLKNYPVTLSAELDKAALKAEVKKVAPELAEDFNKQFGTSITSKDIEKAFDSLIKKEEAERKALAKQEEATKKTLADIDEKFQKAQTEGMRKEQEAKEKANLKARMDENKAYNDMLAETKKAEDELAEAQQKKALAFIKENEEYEKNKTQEEYANKYLEERNNLYDKIIERLKVYEDMRKRIAKGDMKAGDSEINAQMLMAEIEGYMDQYEHNPHFNAPKSKVDYVVNKFDSIDKEAEELDILRRSEEEYKKLTKLVNEYANARMRIAVGKAREGDVDIVNNREFENRIKELQQKEVYSQKREQAATERLRDLDKEIEEAQNKSAARKEDPAIKARENAIKNYIKKLKELANYEEQIKDLHNRGVVDDDPRIKFRNKNIQEIKDEISAMEDLNLTEEENLNIQTQVNEARRKYAVNIKEANDKKDSASGQQSLNATKQEYIKLLKEENDLLMKNYQLEKAGEAAGKEYSDNETEIQKIQKTKEATADLLRTKGQEEFVTTEIARANKELYEKQTAYNKKLKNEEEALQKRRLNLLQQITQWLNANPIADKKYGSLLADGIKTLNSSAEVTPEILKQIETEFKNVKLEATKAGETGAGFFQILKQRWQSLGAYLASFASFYRVAAYVRQAITSVRELDDALTEMRKVSDESVSTLKAFQQESFAIADQVGSTAKVIQDSTADWMRLGESLNEAKESAKDASILLNVSEFQSIDEATTALVAMSQAYKEMDKIDIIDKLNNIGNNFSISTDQLATGLQNAAAVLKTQGNDIDKSIALLTAANSIVQDISKASTGIRTIALRIAGTETAKKELEELGESVDDYIVQTQSKTQETIKAYTAVASNAGRGIDVLDANGNLRDTYDILLDISKIYKEIQEEDKKAGTNRAKALVEYIAGKNRSNIAASVLENPELLEEVYKASQDSAGSALEENEKYLDSISGHIAKLQNQLQKLYTDTIDSGFVKWTLDLLTNVTKLVDKVGLLRSAIIGIVTVIGSKKLGYCN